MKTIQLQVSITVDKEAEAALIDIFRQAINAAVGFDEQREARVKASHHANLAGQKMPEVKGLLIDIKATAKLLDLSERTVWGMANSGRIPKPIKIGRLVRWSHEEFRAWVSAGCPAREKWERQRKE